MTEMDDHKKGFFQICLHVLQQSVWYVSKITFFFLDASYLRKKYIDAVSSGVTENI